LATLVLTYWHVLKHPHRSAYLPNAAVTEKKAAEKDHSMTKSSSEAFSTLCYAVYLSVHHNAFNKLKIYLRLS